MSRVINVNNPTKIRNQHRRTIAEILRHLIQKPEMDAEARDMAAMLVYLLRGIQEGIEQSATAWEKRGYWMKAERFLGFAARNTRRTLRQIYRCSDQVHDSETRHLAWCLQKTTVRSAARTTLLNIQAKGLAVYNFGVWLMVKP